MGEKASATIRRLWSQKNTHVNFDGLKIFTLMGSSSSKATKRKSKLKPKSQAKLHHEPTAAEYAEIRAETKFNDAELRALWLRYKLLSDSQEADGKIDIHEFQAALGLRSSGFTYQLFSAFDSDGSFQIDFYEFARGIYAMSARATLEDKARFCFRVYDSDGNGTIDRDELCQILRFSLGETSAVALSEDQLKSIVDRTYEKLDMNHDGGISFQEFLSAATRNPQILACLNINVEELLQT
jgi:serine/threonine-protein phosphatase 2B regulatory subunit